MSRFLLDTDTVTHLLRAHPAATAAITAHAADEVAVGIVTLEEVWQG